MKNIGARIDLPYWRIPESFLDIFNSGAIISAGFPESWKIKPNDIIRCELKNRVARAIVLEVGKEKVKVLLCDDKTGESEREVSGVICLLKKSD